MDECITRKLKSEDGEVFEVEVSVLKTSKFLNDLICDYPDSDQDIIINEVNKENLQKIIDYLRHYENAKPKEIPKPLPNDNLKEYLDEWDYNYINPLSLEKCIDLLNAAAYLDIQDLVVLCSAKLASHMLRNTVEEVLDEFTWKNITEEDKKKYGLND